MKLFAFAAAASAALALGSAAQAAPNLVTNGSFETSTQTIGHEFGASYIYGQSVTGWQSLSPTAFNLWFPDATTATTVDASTRFSEPGQYLWNLPGSVPDGRAFVALDGDPVASGALTQLISGLTVGASYNLTFSWAAAQYRDRVGDTTERLDVSFGGESFSTATVPNASMSSTGWLSLIHI